MKPKNKYRSLAVRTLSLFLGILIGFATAVPALSGLVAEAATDPVLTVSIAWRSDVKTQGGNSNLALASESDRTVVVSANGPASESTTVKVVTFDISARASEGEFPAMVKEYTLKGGESAEFSISSSSCSHNDHESDEHDKATQIQNGAVITKQFGVKIASVTNNAVIGNNFLRAYVNARNGTLTVVKNASLPYYNSSFVSEALTPGCLPNGYSYLGAMDMYTYPSRPDYTTEAKETAVFTFDPTPSANYNMSQLLDYFDTLDIYYTGSLQISDNVGNVIKTGGFSLTIQENGATRFRNAHEGSRAWNDATLHWLDNTSIYNETETSSGIYSFPYHRGKADTGHEYTRFLKYGGSGNVTVKMYNYASYYKKNFNNVYYSSTLADVTAPSILEYYVYNGTPYGYNMGDYDDKIYLAVRFSKPVQVEELNLATAQDFGIKTSVLDADGTKTGELTFDYVDGSMTDTLIFEASLDTYSAIFSRTDIYGEQLRIEGFITGDARVADMLVNLNNRNNAYDFSNYDEADTTIPCVINTRLPELTRVNITQGTRKEHKLEVRIEGLGNNGSVEYKWSSVADMDQIDQSNWSKLSYVDGLNTISGSSYNGNMYLHIRAETVTGITTTLTEGPFLFDNTAPTIASVDNNYGQYQKEHTLRIEIDDALADVENIWLTVTAPDQTKVIDHAHVYNRTECADSDPWHGRLQRLADDPTTEESEADIWEMTLSWQDIELAADSYGAYIIGFEAEDSIGNHRALTNGAQPALFDNRDTFQIEMKSESGGAISPDATLDGIDIFYNNGLNFQLVGQESGSSADVYTLYSITCDDTVIYENGALQVADWATGGFAAVPTVGNVAEAGDLSKGRMEAAIKLNASAAGLYRFIFLQGGEKQSSILSVYVSPSETEPTNYAALTDAERLLVNRVWQFATPYYYTLQNGVTPVRGAYDVSTTSSKSTPIFSSPEKAFDYALFMEYQDISILHLREDSVSQSAIESLNLGAASTSYYKAEGESTVAAPNQTWICYKSKSWTPNSGFADERSSWVYYFYSDGIVENIELSEISGRLVEQALRDNAADIAGVVLDSAGRIGTGERAYLYLTKHMGLVDEFDQPDYAKTAIFYDAQVVPAEQTAFASALSYSGDEEIYSSYISYKDGDTTLTVPIVANYTFLLPDDFHRVYFRAHGVQAWTSVKNGQTLKEVLGASGLYDLAEIGGGYRTYTIYFDNTAPLVASKIERQGQSYDLAFSSDMNGSEISAAKITLHNILDQAHAVSGRPVEYDSLSYIYFTAGTTIQQFHSFISLEELNRENFSLELPTGKLTMYVYDRLGNYAMIPIRTNTTALITKEPEILDGNEVAFYVNRNKDEIKTYEIYRNSGETPLASLADFAQTKTFVQSGEYVMYVEDIYGNSEIKTIQLKRDPPILEFSYKNAAGGYTVFDSSDSGTSSAGAAAALEFISPNVYYISTAVDIRISYALTANYKYTVTPTDTPLNETITASSGRYLDIPATDKKWTLKVYHANDPDTCVIVTCVKDTEAPVISAHIEVPQYIFNDENGHDNVLFYPDETVPTKEESVKNGGAASAQSLKFAWHDESEVASVTYSFNNGAEKTVTPSSGALSVEEAGHYKVTATDILGNSSTFEFTLSHDAGFDFYVDGVQTEYKSDPQSYIIGKDGEAVYSHTVYASQEFDLRLKEDMTVLLAWTDGNDRALYRMAYENGEISVGVYDERAEDGIRFTTYSLNEGDSGTLIDAIRTPVRYTYENGILKLSMPRPTLAYEQWQIRLSDVNNLNPRVVQVERCGVAPDLDVVSTDGKTRLEPLQDAYIGINKEVVLEGDLTKIVSIRAYYSKLYLNDFSLVPTTDTYELLASGKVGSIKEEGYYKLVVTDIYGNEQVILLRISYGLSIDLIADYQTLEDRVTTLTDGGSFSLRSNQAVSINIWNPDATVTLTKDGQAVPADITNADGHLKVNVSDVGEYVMQIEDACHNAYTISISIQAPKTIVYDAYLAGFNADALRKDENYTNEPLTLNAETLKEKGIDYVAYRKIGETAWTVLYDLLSADPAARIDQVQGKVGSGDGDFEVVFANSAGDCYEMTVHISSAEQISISRNTQTATEPEAVQLSSALERGAWSNFKVTLKVTAEQYALKINGKEAFVDENGEYILQLPSGMGEGSADYAVEFLDEYGNQYSFTVHLYRRVPTYVQKTDAEIRVLSGMTFVRGDVSYTWEDPLLVASYTKDKGSPKPYTMGQVLTEDGVYNLTFTDAAGNIAIATVTRDTAVSYQLTQNNATVPSGIAANGSFIISTIGEKITATEILKDGVAIEQSVLTFTEHGSYAVTLVDEIGNTEQVRFDIFDHAVKGFVYTAQPGYAISSLWYHVGGQPLSYVGGVTVDDFGNAVYNFDSDGEFEIELLHLESNSTYSFTLIIDNVAPVATLVGVENGQVTRQNVQLSGLEEGETVEIWKDGELLSTQVISASLTSPEINEKGLYKVIIRDAAGNETVYEFEREFTTNTTSNVLICFLLLAISMGGILLIHSRGKVRNK